MTGTFVCPERIERGGRLVAFKGQVMTMDEAIALDLVASKSAPEPEQASEPERAPEPRAKQKTKPKAKRG